MAALDFTRQLRTMRRDWNRRARENARHYVVTGQHDWSDEDFFRSGEETFEGYILSDLTNVCQGLDPRRMTVLEIGCGAGRVTRAFARYFGQVYAVDISREMVKRARNAVQEFPNTRILRNNGKDLAALGGSLWERISGRGIAPQFDFAFSYLVFQHIPSRAIIENYVRETNRVLRPGGLFKFQVQGAPQVETNADDSWVGAPFTRRDAEEMAARCGFEMRYDHGAGGQYYWLWFFKNRNAG